MSSSDEVVEDPVATVKALVAAVGDPADTVQVPRAALMALADAAQAPAAGAEGPAAVPVAAVQALVTAVQDKRAEHLARLKVSRPEKINNPQTRNDYFKMFSSICEAGRKDELEEKIEKKNAAVNDLLGLPYIYVTNDDELEFLKGIGGDEGYQGNLYLGIDVTPIAIDAYKDKYHGAKIKSNVVALKSFT